MGSRRTYLLIIQMLFFLKILFIYLTARVSEREGKRENTGRRKGQRKRRSRFPIEQGT